MAAFASAYGTPQSLGGIAPSAQPPSLAGAGAAAGLGARSQPQDVALAALAATLSRSAAGGMSAGGSFGGALQGLSLAQPSPYHGLGQPAAAQHGSGFGWGPGGGGMLAPLGLPPTTASQALSTALALQQLMAAPRGAAGDFGQAGSGPARGPPQPPRQ